MVSLHAASPARRFMLSLSIVLLKAIKTTLGPMARSVKDVELCMRVVAEACVRLGSSHHNIIPLPFREVQLEQKLRIGYMVEGEESVVPFQRI